MSLRNLKYLFRPECVAVIGASNRSQRVGSVLIRNLLQGGFSGPIMPVNPKYSAVAGVLAYAGIDDLPKAPHLAVICTPPCTVPGLIKKLGTRGTRAAIVITAGLSQERNATGETLQQEMVAAAKRFNVRVLGPNCLGLLIPKIGLNASFSHVTALPGKIGFISQSGALATTVLDWAHSKGIGFSHFVSLGDAVDIDFGDVLDYLATDPTTRAIMMYIESIRHPRNFLSAARAAASRKPILVIKAGRRAEGERAARCHTGALACSDAVFDAAVNRAGMLRVYHFNELFAAVETLAHSIPVKAERLVIVTNGGGPGVVAVDSLVEQGGELAELSEETKAKLDAVLPPTWSRANPVDIIGDASGSRYAEALQIFLEAPEADAVLVMHAPTAISSSDETARAVIDTVRNYKGKPRKQILTNWLGEDGARMGRSLFSQAAIPSYRTPEGAVRAFIHLLRYRRNQELLMETPPSMPTSFTGPTSIARQIIEKALAAGNSGLSEPEAKAVLAAYGIPTVSTEVAATPEQAASIASLLGFPVALKIFSPDISHKSDVGGVVLNLPDAETVLASAQAMLARVRQMRPEADIQGFTIQKMVSQAAAHELMIGMTTDPVFGPVLLFGQGGTAVELIDDTAVTLPPLNMRLARELISRTRVHKLLNGYRDQPAADLDSICVVLMKVEQMVIDLPEVVALDINPLIAWPQGVLAVDARIQVESHAGAGIDRLAIRPYPRELEEVVVTRSGRKVLLRPIRPEDEAEHQVFTDKLTPEDIYFRFFRSIGKMSHSEMAKLTQIDYHREMALIAEGRTDNGTPETLGVVRGLTDPDNSQAEFSVIVRSDQQGQGLGRLLMKKMIDYCRSRGTQEMVGDILLHNTKMLKLAKTLGFEQMLCYEDRLVQVRLDLQAEEQRLPVVSTRRELQLPAPEATVNA